jgi:hypothetical protein
MNYLILTYIFVFTIPFVTSITTPKVKKNQPKFCVNCKYFMPSDTDNQYGKCSMFPTFPTGTSNPKFLVTGTPVVTDSYYYCTTARGNNNLCGELAKKYKKIRKNAKKIKI